MLHTKPCSTKGAMANLTITVDEETLKKARLIALEQKTSVNRILQQYLEAFAGVNRERQDAAEKILSLSCKAQGRRGVWRWNRDELHERQ